MAMTPPPLRSSTLLNLFIVVTLAVIGSAAARPGCHFYPLNRNTIFITYTSVSGQNPSLPTNLVTISDEFIEIYPKPPLDFSLNRFLARDFDRSFQHSYPVEVDEKRDVNHPFRAIGHSSLHDRTKDILGVVASLLLGVACGALTAATFFVVWYVFFNHGEERSEEMVDSSSDDEDLYSPKKSGYVAVPAAPVAAAAKEVV